MHAQAKMIAGNLIQQQFMVGQNFPQILAILEDVILGTVMSAATSPQSSLAACQPREILAEFTRRVLAKVDSMEPLDVKAIVAAAVRSQQILRAAQARAEEDN
jgi:hypothetical protein